MKWFRRESLVLLTLLVASGVLTIPLRADAGYAEQLWRLKSSDLAEDHRFGERVALSGDHMIASSWGYGAFPTFRSGAAYIFNVHSGEQKFKLTASDPAMDAGFLEVAISENTAIVGSRNAPTNQRGAAYVYDVDTGTQRFKLTASDGAQFDQFGASVAISGNKALVGAPSDDIASAVDAGSVYLFDVANGQELAKYTSATPSSNGYFGHLLAVDGNLAVISERAAAHIIDTDTGAVLQTLIPSGVTGGSRISSVAIGGGYAILGLPSDNTDPSGFGDGASYVFDVFTGEQLYRLTASDAAEIEGRQLGYDIAISGNLAVISGSTPAAGPGAVYVFDLTSGSELYSVRPPDGHPMDNFGRSVALDRKTLLIGAGGHWNMGMPLSGAVYVYQLVPEPNSPMLLVGCLAGLIAQRRIRVSPKKSQVAENRG